MCVFLFIYSFFWCSGIRAYEQLGNRAFGHPGKMLAACVITVHNIGGNVAPFVLCLIMDKQAHFKAYRMWYMCNKVFFLKPCPATSSLWSLSSLWLFRPSWVKLRTQGECWSPSFMYPHSSSEILFLLTSTDVFVFCLSGCLSESGSWMETTWSSLLAFASSFL